MHFVAVTETEVKFVLFKNNSLLYCVAAMSGHDETASLLVGSAITSAPVPTNCSKPVLMRQECTTFLVSSHHPQLSILSDSEEDDSHFPEENSTRSVPDIELHCR